MMNKTRFRILVFLMSISLIGIILVQLYWISTSLDKNEEEFKYHVQQVLGNVSNTINEKELVSFYNHYNKIIDNSEGYAKMMSFMLTIVDEREKLIENKTKGKD